MKRMFLLVIAMYIGISITAEAQIDGKQALKEFHRKEKMRLTPTQIENILKNKETASDYLKNKSDKYADKLQSLETGVISQRTYPESELHSAVNPSNPDNIVVSPIRQNPNNPMKSLSCPVFYTTDAGTSWNESSFETFTLGNNGIPMGGGDPMFTYDADGTLYFSWIYLYGELNGGAIDSLYWGVFWAYSNDGGVTFKSDDDPIIGNARGATPFNGGQPILSKFHDKQWLAADLSNSQYRNNVYASLVTINKNEGYVMQLFTKEAGKSNFNYEPIRISPMSIGIVQFGSLDVDSRGWVHIMFYGETGGQAAMYHAVSKDGGKSIDQVTKISNFFGTDPTQLAIDEQQGKSKPTGLSRLYPAPNITIDKSGGEYDGYLYATWTAKGVNSNTNTGLDIYFSKSTNSGDSWSDPIILNDNTDNLYSDQFYSAQMVSPNGTYAIAWYDRREDNNNNNAHYYYTFSKDGGSTFDQNKAVTNIPSDFSKIGQANNNFGIGEYNQLIITDTYFMPIWGDGRSNDGNVNIMFAKESLSGVEDKGTFGTLNSGITIESISPMPITSRAIVNMTLKNAGSYNFEIYTVDGKQVFGLTKTLQSGNQSLNLDLNLATGIYFIKISNGNTYIGQKILVE